jgi:hypothetical protein
MDSQETQAKLDRRHKTNTHKTKNATQITKQMCNTDPTNKYRGESR